ncbi:hypothetical protein BS47DRAFT_1364812 [Hydnum rufescens UP504]|uniref:Uncharacterized protein n=1 Tax=Hydnum rufescens UP504 TaxID=1448309 RepID=A0A9P6ASN3_9AGAM|nr:hypothetical protein BS47DRAFT_1364812 [Hydnum rufescens UP504]
MDLCSHPQPDNLTAMHPMALIPGWCAVKEEPMVPHTCCSGLLFPLQNLTRSQHRQSLRQNTNVCSHPKAQPQTPTMTAMVSQIQYHTPTAVGLSPTMKPHLPKEYIDKAQGNIWAHAQPCKTSMLDYPQYNDATHLPKWVPLLHDTPPGKVQDEYEHVSPQCTKPHPTRTQPRSKTKNGHAQPPATHSKNPTPEHNNGGNMVPHTPAAAGPSPQTPTTSEMTGKAPSPLQKIMPEMGWVTV